VSADDLTAWLRDTIRARRALAEAAMQRAEVKDGHWYDGEDEITDEDGLRLATVNHPDVTAHIAANDPRTVLASCEADLAILDEHYILTRDDENEDYADWSVVTIGGADRDRGCATCHYYGQGGVKGYGRCRTVRALGSAYRFGPGWREEWALPSD
jgi:hypothetical protein